LGTAINGIASTFELLHW